MHFFLSCAYICLRMKKKSLLIIISFFLISPIGFSQSVKLMCWNLLNYPDVNNPTSDSTLRHPFYRTVVEYEHPDILVTEENTSSSAPTWFLNSVMNANGNTYSKGTFINGPDTDNEIYFKTSDFYFISNTAIRTDLRYISEFK